MTQKIKGEIRTALLNNKGTGVNDLVLKYGKKEVEEIVGELIYGDQANIALEAATELEEKLLMETAAHVVLKSGGYSDHAKDLATKTLKNLET